MRIAISTEGNEVFPYFGHSPVESLIRAVPYVEAASDISDSMHRAWSRLSKRKLRGKAPEIISSQERSPVQE
jgi:hypothetical protein